MKILVILNEAPYGSERTYNGLRLSGSLSRQTDVALRLFLIGDAASAAKAGQKVPHGYYNAANMVSAVVRHGGTVGICGTCMDARGVKDEELLEGTRRSTLDELSSWTLEADKVLTF
jgi:uncharacterized protein involved in oxidation of intracellular sulfur